MLFSTKAEYGVRLMVELGRAARLDAGLPEHRRRGGAAAALLSRAPGRQAAQGRAWSTRPAAPTAATAWRRPAEEITMDSVVEALEGQIAPMECFHETPEGKVLCSHESDGDHACATKLLWTRVQGGVTKALAGTTLAELVEFAGPARAESADAGRQRRLTRTPETERYWLSWRYATCT